MSSFYKSDHFVISQTNKKNERKVIHAVIKHSYFKLWRAAQIKAELDKVEGHPRVEDDFFLDYEFKHGRNQ